jgi:3-phosphoshikimate 1-carboxyvinyltransferase
MTTLVIRGSARINGSVSVPGDKSLSHRGLMLGAMATGSTTLRNLASGADVASTAGCLAAYGVGIERREGTVTIDSSGIANWIAPSSPLDCGNSGTTMRLLAGLAAHREFRSRFDGDASLRKRPMERVAGPLRAFGARVDMSEGGVAPFEVAGGELHGTEVSTGVASAQVKSSALLAALGAEGSSVVIEPLQTRDHTERFLAALGADISWARTTEGNRIEVAPFVPPPFDLNIPGDVSSAAFVVAAGVLAGEVELDSIGLNASRIGFLEALRGMGADISWETDEERMHEQVGRIVAKRSSLRSVSIGPADVPAIHDELPLLAVLATQADGQTIVSGAEELRVKESDRIATTVAGLRAMGADIDERRDGFVVSGPTDLSGAVIDAADDHRIAMAFAVAGLVAKGETSVEGFESADISWPGFDEVLTTLGAEVELR